MRYASAGIGAYQHVNTEILAKRAGGLQLLHIPFKDGGSGILKEVASGDVHATWFNITNPVGMIKAGKVRPLAIAAPERLKEWPDVPTLDELGFTGFRPSQWNAAFAPAGVPREIIDKLHEAFSAAAKTPEMQAIFEKGGMRAPTDKSVEEARAWLRQEMETWRQGHRRRRHQGGYGVRPARASSHAACGVSTSSYFTWTSSKSCAWPRHPGHDAEREGTRR